MSDTAVTGNSEFVRAAHLSELGERGNRTVKVAGQNVLLLRDGGGTVHALDWRCPHMGFPLSKGSVQDGILTCHWHHARFELCSGGTFDPWADDVRVYPVELRGDEIWVDPTPQRDEASYQRGRLQDGLERNLPLVMAKAVLALLDEGIAPAEVLRQGGRFGATQRAAGWRDGLTILSALGNLLPHLEPTAHPLALYHGLLHVANNVEGQQPHFALEPLPREGVTAETLRGWLRQFAEVRDRDGVERVLLTAVSNDLPPATIAEMLFAAATDHYFLDTGHTIDFLNKACELLDRIGWEEAATILPSIVPPITGGQRMEERSAWRTPVALPAILEPLFARLLAGELCADPTGGARLDDGAWDALVESLLGDDPAASAHALADALAGGAALTELSLALCHAALLRVARFSTSNEFSDWIAVLHTLTNAHATHRLLQRAPSLAGARAIWHAAMHLYLNRFLNLPAARLPTDEAVAALPTDAGALRARLLELTDRQQRVEEAAAVVHRWLQQGHPAGPLLEALAEVLLREDGEFHSYQMLEAGLCLYHELAARRPEHAPVALHAIARYLAGHAPTDRATTQTFRIAARLHAGEALAAE